MKKKLIVLIVAMLIIGAFMGCDWFLLTHEQLVDGLSVTFGSYITVSIIYAGDTAEYQYDFVNDILTFTNYDVSDADLGYSTISGTVDEELANGIFDIQLSGGDISTIQYTLTNAQISSFMNNEPVTINMTANDADYVLEMTASDY